MCEFFVYNQFIWNFNSGNGMINYSSQFDAFDWKIMWWVLWW